MNKEMPKCNTQNGEHVWTCKDSCLMDESGFLTPNYLEVMWECYNCALVICQAYTSDGCGWDIIEEE